jgi:hypothetical protein
LKANVANPLTMTFSVYGGGDAGGGISTYNWDVNYDGVSRDVDYSGSSTSVTHDYDTPGTYKVQVWGTGTGDGLEYSATAQFTIYDLDEGAPPPPDLPEPPPEEPIEDPDDPVTPYVDILDAYDDQTIELGQSADIHYEARNVTILKMYDETSGGSVDLSDTLVGHLTVTPTVTTQYRLVGIDAAGLSAQDFGLVTIGALTPGYMQITMDKPQKQYNNSTVYTVPDTENVMIYVTLFGADTNQQVAFPTGFDPVLTQAAALPDDLTPTLDVTPTFDPERLTATFATNSFALGVGVIESLSTIKSILNNMVQPVTDALSNLLVYDKTVDLVVTIVDEDGVDLTEIESTITGDPDDATAIATATVYLKIEAQVVGGGATVTTFANDITLLKTIGSGYATTDEQIDIQYPRMTGSSTWTATGAELLPLNAERVPGTTFLNGDAGFCVIETVITYYASYDFTDAKYQDVTFDVVEDLT